ncbi:MAG TPA: polyphenol oxidase family protein [Acidimicrobiia bacterium]|nr:polyphenol oxidase family protein [Acidimicrobiia bacterium]
MTGAPLEHTVLGPAHVWWSTREHGNVGDHVGDDPRSVAGRRLAVARRADLPDPDAWVWVRQVHGAEVLVTELPTPEPVDADAIVTAATDLPIAVVTADCAPIALASDDGIGIVHAGHRGLLHGVVEAAVKELRALGPSAVHAFVAPCIHVDRYEFGAGDLAPFIERFGPSIEGRTRHGQPALDLPGAVTHALHDAGVADVRDSGVCTAASPSYFSYRRDGATGRQLTVVVRRSS